MDIARGHRRAALVAAVCAVVCCWYHAWIITRGKPLAWNWPDRGEGYYGLLARGFASGHTYLNVQPSPELLALADPYEPTQNQGLRLHDAVLYENRYYFYWGPVPAVLIAPLKMLPQRWRIDTPDELLVMIASFGLIFASAALIVLARERLFPSAPWWTAAIGVLAAGWMHPVPFTLARPAVYEAAIIGGQCFLMMGMLFAFKGLDRRPRYALLAMAGLLWALATGTRLSLAPAVSTLAALAMVRIVFLYRDAPTRQRVLAGAGLAVPLIAGALALCVYNKVRFDSFTEFGTRYELTGTGVNSHATGGLVMSASFFWPNLHRYLFESASIEPTFPFLVATGFRPEFMARYQLPSLYIMEPLVGMVWFAPFLFLGIIPVVALYRRRSKPNLHHERWLTMSLLMGAIVSVLPPLLMQGSTMRYQLDGSPFCVILATLGVLSWAQANQRAGHQQRALMAAVGPLLMVSIVFGVLLGMSGYYWGMRENNPQLWEWMSNTFSNLGP